MAGAELGELERLRLFVELAEELGVTSNTVARYERDELAIPEPVARLTVLIQKLKAEKRRRP